MRCNAVHPSGIVPGPVAECSAYINANQPSLVAMREIAWFISSDKKKGKAGFLTPEEYRKEQEGQQREPLVLPGGGVEW